MYNDNEFVKIFRKMLNWEWYTDVNTKTLFLHCLLKANWKSGSWHGYKYEKGQFVTSLPSLAKETGLSVREVRTALNHLKSTGELTDWHDNKIRIITVVAYSDYQKGDRQTGSPATGKRQANDRRATADIRTYKNTKEEKKNIAPPATPSDDPSKEELQALYEQIRREDSEYV